MGGHLMFDDVLDYLCGMNVYLDTSFAHYVLGDNGFVSLCKKHGLDKILFASDSPWDNAKVQADIIETLDFSENEKDMIFYKNAKQLLNM